MSTTTTAAAIDNIQQQALKLQTKASKLLQEKNLSDAIPIFEEAMKLDPNSSIIILGNSHEHFEKKAFAECITACDEELAALESRRHQIEETKKTAAEKLEESRAAAVKAKAEVVKIFKDDIKLAITRKNYPQALGVYDQWCQFEPENPVLREQMSRLYQKLQNWEPCVKICNAGIEICSKYDPSGKEYPDTLTKLQERKAEAEKNFGTSKATVEMEKYHQGSK